jgi:hypothetical protein
MVVQEPVLTMILAMPTSRPPLRAFGSEGLIEQLGGRVPELDRRALEDGGVIVESEVPK